VNTDDAKTFYEWLMCSVSWIGSRLALKEDDPPTVTEKISDGLLDIASQVEKTRKSVDRPWWIATAPSAWHAALYIIGLQEQLRSDVSVAEPLLFRGHADARWEILPALLRKGVDRAREQKLFRLFRRFALHFHLQHRSFWPAPTTESHLATAQHYGIKTNLIDFTSDPTVAVSFACSEAPSRDLACVFGLPLRVGRQFRAGALLPHPYTRRLYRQRGVFIHTPRANPVAIRRECIEVHFPVSVGFVTYRHGKPTDLLEPDSWIESLIAEARARVLRGGRCGLGSRQIDDTLSRMKTAGIAFPDHKWDADMLPELILGIEELMSDLATSHSESGMRGNRPAVDVLVADNPVFMKNYLDLHDDWLLAEGYDLSAPRKDSLTAVLRSSLRAKGLRSNAELRLLSARVRKTAVKTMLGKK
jgi:hypothetical protein